MSGLLIITLISSFGFHYFETVNQSLQLQWLPKDKAPKIIGWLVGAGSLATLFAYLGIIVGWQKLRAFIQFFVFIVGWFNRFNSSFLLIFFPKL